MCRAWKSSLDFFGPYLFFPLPPSPQPPISPPRPPHPTSCFRLICALLLQGFGKLGCVHVISPSSVSLCIPRTRACIYTCVPCVGWFGVLCGLWFLGGLFCFVLFLTKQVLREGDLCFPRLPSVIPRLSVFPQL